jgi:hypothetical protein
VCGRMRCLPGSLRRTPRLTRPLRDVTEDVTPSIDATKDSSDSENDERARAQEMNLARIPVISANKATRQREEMYAKMTFTEVTAEVTRMFNEGKAQHALRC